MLPQSTVSNRILKSRLKVTNPLGSLPAMSGQLYLHKIHPENTLKMPKKLVLVVISMKINWGQE